MTIELIGLLEKSIKEYCKLNNIDNIDNFSKKCLQLGFNITKFGTDPKDNINRENLGIIDDAPKIEEEKKIRKPRVSKKKAEENNQIVEKDNGSDKDIINPTTIEAVETTIEVKKPTIRKIKITKKS